MSRIREIFETLALPMGASADGGKIAVGLTVAMARAERAISDEVEAYLHDNGDKKAGARTLPRRLPPCPESVSRETVTDRTGEPHANEGENSRQHRLLELLGSAKVRMMKTDPRPESRRVRRG